MQYSQHVINYNRVASANDLSSGPYPIGLSLTNFLDLFADVKSFDVSLVGIIDRDDSQNINAISLNDAINNLELFGGGDENSVFAGSTTRKVLPVGILKPDGTEYTAARVPTPITDYPVHSGGGSAALQIDFGRTLVSSTLFFPYISIIMGNGMGNLVGGDIIGAVDMDRYGVIPIYSGGNVGPTDFAFAGGTISVNERYSMLRADAIKSGVGSSVTLRATSPLSSLRNYTTAYFGAASAPIVASQNQLTMVVPQNAKSGPIRIQSEGPQFDSFLSYDEILIS